jgi:ABC-type uncharacterized transport system substrate-binding protein
MAKSSINLPVIFVTIVFAFAGLFVSTSFAAEKRHKVLYVDSYHAEYPWSAGVTAGVNSVLAMRPDVELKITRMDTKRNTSEEFKKGAALKVKKLIENWQPDIVIASDDNASKYLIAPYYKNADLPFVFCGVNWDASSYGFPCKNVTGMVEVALGEELIRQAEKFISISRLGFLAPDMTSTRKDVQFWQKKFGVRLTHTTFVKTMAEWKKSYLALQDEVDMIILPPWQGIADWQHDEIVNFLYENAKIPTGTMVDYMTDYALLCFARVPSEQGEYAARTALEILAGKSPADIPVVTNQKAKVILNMKLAKKMGIKFPMELMRNATLISAEQKKLLYVNSYHKGYLWSDDIEKGLLKALSIKLRDDGTFDISKSSVSIKMIRMDTKRNKGEKFKKQAALKVKKIIEKWQPDIVVASDDNAAKYLIVPYFKGSELPIVFCGLNYSAAEYGFPASNITGMIEVAPNLHVLESLRKYAKGERVGYLGGNVLTRQKEYEWLSRKEGIEFAGVKLVESFEQWKAAYLELQDSVDMLLMVSPVSVKDWDREKALKFIFKHSKIPSGTTLLHTTPYVLVGHVKIAEEQGWWAGKTALKILDGTPPAQIPVVRNQSSRLYLNMKLAEKLGIKFPMDLIKDATFVKHED